MICKDDFVTQTVKYVKATNTSELKRKVDLLTDEINDALNNGSYLAPNPDGNSIIVTWANVTHVEYLVSNCYAVEYSIYRKFSSEAQDMAVIWNLLKQF